MLIYAIRDKNTGQWYNNSGYTRFTFKSMSWYSKKHFAKASIRHIKKNIIFKLQDRYPEIVEFEAVEVIK